MRISLRSDKGYSLGLVIIFVMTVGTVLGSVMAVTEFSADAQGRGVDQLQASNTLATASADVIQQMTVQSSLGQSGPDGSNLPNCGLSERWGDVSVSCIELAAPVGSKQSKRYITFTDHRGNKSTKEVTISFGENNSDPARISESN
jgi:hypothetical protein